MDKPKDCNHCEGRGVIDVYGETLVCPRCKGTGENKHGRNN